VSIQSKLYSVGSPTCDTFLNAAEFHENGGRLLPRVGPLIIRAVMFFAMKMSVTYTTNKQTIAHLVLTILIMTFGADPRICVRGGPSPSLPLPFTFIFTLPCLPLRIRPLKPGRGCWGVVSSLSGVRGGTPAENEFGAL